MSECEIINKNDVLLFVLRCVVHASLRCLSNTSRRAGSSAWGARCTRRGGFSRSTRTRPRNAPPAWTAATCSTRLCSSARPAGWARRKTTRRTSPLPFPSLSMYVTVTSMYMLLYQRIHLAKILLHLCSRLLLYQRMYTTCQYTWYYGRLLHKWSPSCQCTTAVYTNGYVLPIRVRSPFSLHMTLPFCCSAAPMDDIIGVLFPSMLFFFYRVGTVVRATCHTFSSSIVVLIAVRILCETDGR